MIPLNPGNDKLSSFGRNCVYSKLGLWNTPGRDFKGTSIFLLLLLVMSITHITRAQKKYKTTSGMVTINASTPLEDVYAENKSVNGILQLEDGRFAIVMLVKDFEFPRKLMQEHFNENYMESDSYPKAYFSGDIDQLQPDALGTESSFFNTNGQLSIHGVNREIKEKISLKRQGDNILLQSTFKVRPEDHAIEVPKLLFEKIAEEVTVDVELLLKPQP